MSYEGDEMRQQGNRPWHIEVNGINQVSRAEHFAVGHRFGGMGGNFYRGPAGAAKGHVPRRPIIWRSASLPSARGRPYYVGAGYWRRVVMYLLTVFCGYFSARDFLWIESRINGGVYGDPGGIPTPWS